MLTDSALRTLQSLWREMSGSDREAATFAQTLRANTEGDRFAHGAAAVELILDGKITIRKTGSGGLDASDVVYNLYQTGMGPAKAASRLVLAAVAVGGAPDGIIPAWQHMTDTDHIAKNEQLAPSHPVKGIGSPTTARKAYNSCTGDHGGEGSVATANRGAADQQQA